MCIIHQSCTLFIAEYYFILQICQFTYLMTYIRLFTVSAFIAKQLWTLMSLYRSIPTKEVLVDTCCGIVGLTFKEIARLFPKVVITLYIPSSISGV